LPIMDDLKSQEQSKNVSMDFDSDDDIEIIKDNNNNNISTSSSMDAGESLRERLERERLERDRQYAMALQESWQNEEMKTQQSIEQQIQQDWENGNTYSMYNAHTMSNIRPIEDYNSNSMSNHEKQMVNNLVNHSLRHNDIIPMDTPKGLSVELMKHQKHGLSWLIQMEESKRTRGGLLADQMGVGKTVQMIALMLQQRSDYYTKFYNNENSSNSSSINNSNANSDDEEYRPNNDNNNSNDSPSFIDRIDYDNNRRSKRRKRHKPRKIRTLIITPLAIMDQWADEIHNKAPKQFKVTTYYGPTKHKITRHKLKEFDIVITTYGTVSSEYKKGDTKKQGLLYKLNDGFFYRIIADEAHIIKNHKTMQSKGICLLSKKCTTHWCLTGTPIQNGLNDLYGMCRFLCLKDAQKIGSWKSKLGITGSRGRVDTPKAQKKLQLYLSTLMLRRLKDEVLNDFVKRKDEEIKIEFNEQERILYDAFEKKAQISINRYVRHGGINANYMQALTLLLRLRQLCNHPFLVFKKKADSVNNSNDNNNNNNMDDDVVVTDPLDGIHQSIIDRLNAKDTIINSECAICMDVLDPDSAFMYSECGHIFCCENNKNECPMCRKVINMDNSILIKNVLKSDKILDKFKNENTQFDREVIDTMLQVDNNDINDKTDDDKEIEYPDGFIDSSKTRALIKRVKAILQEAPDDKILIFSQFTSTFDLLKIPLEYHNISFLRYDGKLNRKSRQKVLDKFKNSDKYSVLLISLKCASLGLNLTCANRVLFIDLWWNPQISQQAIDRCHRIGQTKTVYVERLIIQKSVEQRILAIQEQKKQIADAALDGAKAAQRLSANEMMNLFGMNN